MKWIRVNKKDRCKICGRADWCDYSPELGLALCMRVESDRPSKNSMGGWLHKIDGRSSYVAPLRRIAKPTKAEGPTPDFTSMWRRWLEATEHYHLDGFAMSLGVDTESLRSLGCVWNGSVWAFPMKNANKEIVGIRLRGTDGRKWAVKGSRQGLFIPEAEAGRTLYILEGPTDTAAALTLGLYAIGRPSCMGCEAMIKEFVRRMRIKRTVIVADNDLPGLRGAEKLQHSLPVQSCTYCPPSKDLREFVNLGGTRQLLEVSLKDMVWQCP